MTLLRLTCNQWNTGIEELMKNTNMQAVKVERSIHNTAEVNYQWLSTKKTPPVKLDSKQLTEIRNIAGKLTSADLSALAVQAGNYLSTEDGSRLGNEEIPEMVLKLLKRRLDCKMLASVTKKKKAGLQRIMSKRISPAVDQPMPSVDSELKKNIPKRA